MKILAIESTCDETSAAIVEDGQTLHSNVVATQIDIHAQYGGVVPEVAARSHLEVIQPVINRAFAEADLGWDDIDAIAVAYAPGLIGSLLVGTLAARTLAVLHDKPLYPVHHVEGHVYANFITNQERHTPPLDSEVNAESTHYPLKLAQSARDTSSEERAIESTDTSAARASSDAGARFEARSEAVSDDSDREQPPNPLHFPSRQPEFPMLALAVSGLHSQLIVFRDHGDYELLGQTLDDAVGEAFDKVAKILGLPYPGGPSVSAAAAVGDPMKYQLPKAKLQGPYDFSFSGLKTAVLRAVQREVGKDFTFPSHELSGLLTASQRNDFAASFQRVAIETLVDKTFRAFEAYSPRTLVIAGGVAANQELRRQLSERLPIDIEYAPMQLCTDNAAMIGALAYYQSRVVQPTDPYSLKAEPTLSMNQTKWAASVA